MKTSIFLKAKKAFAITGLLLAGIVTLNSCDDDDDDDVNNTPYAVTGNATAAQVVPAGTATGTGAFTGSYNPGNRTLTYTTSWTGLTGAPTSAGFYNGASGTAGTAVGSPWTFEAGVTGTGSMTGSMTLTSEQASQLINGNWYYGYNTAANTNGEIRGQLTATR